ncbi:MAG: family phosphatase [Proteobacteria bacterium]|nr:family phosphatase [Pseudomonadota bacterium]
MPIKAIFFDHDGTLVDSEPIHYQLWRDVLAAHGVALGESLYRDCYAGIPTADNAVDLVARFAIDASPAALAEAKNLATRRFLAQHAFPLMPGVRDAVAQCHGAGRRLAIVTGAGADGVQTTLRQHSLSEFFETVVSGDDVTNSKPAPDCYLLAVRRLGLLPSECIAIEDTEHGVNSAVAAGVACLAVPNEMSRNHDFSQASAVFDDLAAAVSWIELRAAAGRSIAEPFQPNGVAP